MGVYPIFRPLLFALDPETAHRRVSAALRTAAGFPGFTAAERALFGYEHPALRLEIWGQAFTNPIGLAAGFDKDGTMIEPLLGLGFGTVEVGTVTPLPQPGNPHPRLFRLPQDDALMRLNRDLGATVLPWGSPMERADIERKRDMAVVASAPVAASRLAYLGKTGGRVNAGAGDLVDAVKEGVVDPATLPAEMLPEPMREMDDEARKAYVEARVAKRGELELQIKKLSKARKDYLRRDAARRAAAGEADSFDAKILDLIRQQAAEKGIRYE